MNDLFPYDDLSSPPNKKSSTHKIAMVILWIWVISTFIFGIIYMSIKEKEEKNMNNNITCQTCGTKFHYCGSCDYDKYMSSGFCNKECYHESYEYRLFKSNLKSFWDSLDDKQKKELFYLWDNGIFIDDKWEFEIDDIIKIESDKESEI